jgi:transcriptional regulator with XRE-family HTH domain
MPKKSPVPVPVLAKDAKPPQVVPDWAKQVKAYREEAGITQGDLQKAFGTKYNVSSPIENGRRKFTAAERKQFFEIIGKPEDTSIPTSERNPGASAPVKASTAKPKATKAKKVTKAAKDAKKPAKPEKVRKAPRKNQEPKLVTTAITVESPAVLTPGIEAEAPKAPVSAPKPRGKRGPKIAPVASLEASEPQEKASATPTPKKTKQPLKAKAAEAVSAPPMNGKPTTVRSAPPAPGSDVSAVKEAVLRDITRILSSPNLSDSQAKALHSLFTSLAVNALLGV